jgi:FkbM family methyltransferase
VIQLPDGRSFYLSRKQFTGAAKFLRSEIFRRSRYRRDEFDLKRVDVGANIGMFTMWAITQIADGRIITLEPTEFISCLELNIRHQGWTNVETLPLAVGDHDGEMELVYYPGVNIISHASFANPAGMTKFLGTTLFALYWERPYQINVHANRLGN